MIKESFKALIKKGKVITKRSKFVRKIYVVNKRTIEFIISFLAGMDLKRKINKCKTLEDFINLVLFFEYSPIKFLPFKLIFKTMQNKYEITNFVKLIQHLKPKYILEIGTARGGTLFLLTKLSHPNAHIISMDLPGGIHGGGYPSSRIPLYKSFSSYGQKITLIREDSHKISMLNRVKDILKKEKLDILFIDGDHTYEGVKKDFEMYSPLVRKSGLIIFHDIVVHKKELNCHVNKFWNEIKENFKFVEIVEDWNQNYFGIGIVYK